MATSKLLKLFQALNQASFGKANYSILERYGMSRVSNEAYVTRELIKWRYVPKTASTRSSYEKEWSVKGSYSDILYKMLDELEIYP